MKISVNWIKEFTSVDLPIEELVEKIGAQLGAVEDVKDLGAKYKGATVVKVVSCNNHPNADKLHVCFIDDGGTVKDVERNADGLVQVVCGASNIAEGQTVVWLPPKTTVPSSFGDDQPFVLDTRELRGVLSNGMIASGKELDINNDHDGILVLDEEVAPGTPFADVYGLNDYIIDIENKMFTHRPDLFGILGIAREIAGIRGVQFKSPDWYLNSSLELGARSPGQLPLQVNNELPELVPRFMAVALSSITIKPSPLKMQTYLNRVGIRPINNVVDITNFIMHLTAQPLHAYDYDKVLAKDPGAKVATLGTRYPQKGEKLTIINGKTIEPRDEAVLITTVTQAIGLGGVMGGLDTEVDDNTKNIILECATFDMYSIRRTAMAHGLFTDAVTRYNKGQSPCQNDRITGYIVKLLQEIAGAQIASEVIDDKHLTPAESVKVSADFIIDRLGLQLNANQISKTLQNVEFDVKEQGGELLITPPFWRTDIAIAEDIVEEVGRLIGYDHLPLALPRRDLTPAKTNKLLDIKKQLRGILKSAGANEVLTYSFVHGNLIDKAGQDKQLAYQLSNAISPDLQYYRMSLTPSLLEKVHPNIKAGHSQFALFEIGKIHQKGWLNEDGLPKEEERLGLIFAASSKNATSLDGAPYYQAQKYVSHLLTVLGLKAEYKQLSEAPKSPIISQLTTPYQDGRAALITEVTSGEMLGVVGEFKQNVIRGLKLPEICAGFELDIAELLKFKDGANNYRPLSKYPKVEQDITLKIPAEVIYGSLIECVAENLIKLKPANTEAELSPAGIFQKTDEPQYKNVTLHLTITSDERTLKAEEVNNLLDEVARAAGHQLGATRV